MNVVVTRPVLFPNRLACLRTVGSSSPLPGISMLMTPTMTFRPVAIAVAAPHRDAAYKASREVIERLKQEVPIWKRERYADGEEEWLRGATPPLPEAD